MEKNVTIKDAYGNTVGSTYPKRARGLVKNGRAIFVDDCTIRMDTKSEPSDKKSEVTFMNYVYFNPRNWSFEQSTKHASGLHLDLKKELGFIEPMRAERCFLNDFDGSLIESLMFGSWNGPDIWAISSEQSLTPDTDYRFVFWLNGGENDRNNEVCRLQIVFFGNLNNCYSYNLNRNLIKPLLHKDGWELYSIPFRTPNVERRAKSPAEEAEQCDGMEGVLTSFAFLAGNAPMAIKAAKAPEFYKEWKDEPDEFADMRPQRHNLVFSDGWPSRQQYGGDRYSTEVLRNRKRFEGQAQRFEGQTQQFEERQTQQSEEGRTRHFNEGRTQQFTEGRTGQSWGEQDWRVTEEKAREFAHAANMLAQEKINLAREKVDQVMEKVNLAFTSHSQTDDGNTKGYSEQGDEIFIRVDE